MGEPPYAVEVTQSALSDLDEMDDYWHRNGQSDRGEKYVKDLTVIALAELSIPYRARLGKVVKSAVLPDTLEIRVFKSSYRIIYRIDEDHHTVLVLRFWHSHRDEPEIE
jgi:mRNA-degrading endonuclease RelE of RelBE toxin-antitoxin system